MSKAVVDLQVTLYVRKIQSQSHDQYVGEAWVTTVNGDVRRLSRYGLTKGHGKYHDAWVDLNDTWEVVEEDLIDQLREVMCDEY